MNSSQDYKTRLEELLIRWEDDELGPEETEELIRTLQEDKSARDALTTHFMMDVGITRGVKEAPTGNTVPFSVRVRESSVLWKRWLIPLAAAASVMIAVGVWWLKPAAGLGLRVAEVRGKCSVVSGQWSGVISHSSVGRSGQASGVTESPSHQVTKSEVGGQRSEADNRQPNTGHRTPATPLRVGDVVRPGDGVEVGGDGYAKLVYPDTTQVELQHDTRMRVTRGAGSEKDAKRLALDGGKFVCSAAPQKKPFEIKTPHAMARVVGTRFSLDVTDPQTLLAVMEGKVELIQVDKILEVEAGETATATDQGMKMTRDDARAQTLVHGKGGSASANVTVTVMGEGLQKMDIIISCDDGYDLYVNGVKLGSGSDWSTAQSYLAVSLQAGKNVVAVKGMDAGMAAALLADLVINGQHTGSSTNWKVSLTEATGWTGVGYDDSAWAQARYYGGYGVMPWGMYVSGMPSDTPGSWIWSSNNDADNLVCFRYSFMVAGGTNQPPVANAQSASTAEDTPRPSR